MKVDFDSQQVYVVGGSTGIGLAVAKRTAALGAHVTIFARRRAALELAADEVRAVRRQPHQRVAWRALDVADPALVTEVMQATVADLGVPDVLINCAGRAYPRRFEDISHEQLAETLRVNLHGCWNTVRALLPYMKAHGGVIVNTASLAGLIGVFGYTDYCASKFGLVGFSEALRQELKPHNIRVFVLCPPDTDTPGFATENQTKPPETRAISGRAKVMSADAVAEALLRGMARGSFLIIPGVDGRLAALAKRLFPGLVAAVMDRAVRSIARAGRTERT